MGRPKKAVSQSNLERFHNELELAGSRTELLLRDKKGRSRSCLLCRRRKQKCDHKQPSCTTCLKACVKCIQPARYRSIAAEDACTDSSPSPSASGFNRVESSSPIVQPVLFKTNGIASSGGSAVGNSCGTASPLDTVRDESSLGDRATFLQSIASPSSIVTKENYKDPYTSSLEKKVRELEEIVANQSCPVGDGHGRRGNSDSYKHENILPPLNAGLTKNLLPRNNKMGNLAASSEIKAMPFLVSDTLQSIDLLKCLFAKYNLKEFYTCDPSFSFSEETSRLLLETFFSRYQFKYPLLEEDEIYTFHENYVNNNICSYSEIEFHFACGRMWLIFSIGGCLKMTTGGYNGGEPVRYFSRAFRHITRCGDKLTYVQQIELLTLLVLYLIRTDRDSLVLYDIVKDTMYICKEKLHLNTWRPNDRCAHKYLRLFWCVYLLERMICVAVGKPYTIAESEIDLPLFDEISFNTRSTKDPKGKNICVHFINQSLILRRLESEFVETLHLLPVQQSKKESSPAVLPLVRKYFHDLEAWRDDCSKRKVKNIENETLKLYFYRSVRLLVQPYLELLGPDDRLFWECQIAAGQICQLFKIFHQKTVTGHSTPSVHTVFVAGVTLIYCMWLTKNNNDQKRKNLGDKYKETKLAACPRLFSTMDDLQACSVCLYVMTERSGFARAFRDTFDRLLSSTVATVVERAREESEDNYFIPFSKNRGTEIGATKMESIEGQSGTGIIPVTTGIFDSGRTTDFSAIVDAPNVELEERNELKLRQGTLEQTSVPKSLAHLLIKVDSNGKVLCESTSGRNGTKRHFDSNENHASKRHISGKSYFNEESDWKSFGGQGPLQQCPTQQRIQRNNSRSLSNPDQNVNDIGQNISEQIIGDPSLNQVSNGKDSASLYVLDPTDPVVPPRKSAIPVTGNRDNRSPTSNPHRNSSVNNNGAVTLPYCGVLGPNGSPSKATRSPQLNSNIFGKENCNNITTNHNTDVLISSDARDMINDISAWTTDSFANPADESSCHGDLPCAYPMSNTNYNERLRNMSSSNDLRGISVPPVMQPISSVGSDRSSQDSRRASMGFSSLLNAGPPLTSITPTDSCHPKPYGSNGSIKLPPSTANGDFIVEEFWTINDDYGFLA